MSLTKTETWCHREDLPQDYLHSSLSDEYEDSWERLGRKSTKKRKPRNKYGFGEIHTLKELSGQITVEQLMSTYNPTEINLPLLRELKMHEYSYKKVGEEFSRTLNKWLELRKEIINDIQKSIQKFRLMHRTTTSVTLFSSTVEFATSIAFAMSTLFHINFRTRLPLLIIPVLGGISMTSTLLALSYTKLTLEDISKKLRNEKRLLRDLGMIYWKGNSTDSAVQSLFPFGIDINLVKETILKDEEIFLDAQSWRNHLCLAIVCANVKKDKNILSDENFLRKVKTFVESSTAQMWLNRMKIRNLLDEMNHKSDNFSDKELTSGRELFLSRAAINLHPAFLPLMTTDSENTEKVRFVGTCLRAVLAIMDLRDNDVDDFREMRDMALMLKEDYKKIKSVSEDLITDYD